MRNDKGYNTKQRNIILDFLKNNDSRHLTVDDIALSLSSMNIKVGKTTIYRYMDKLACEGRVRKYFVAHSKSVCYQYISNTSSCQTHYHFKCTKCNHLLHVDCEMIDSAFEHIQTGHGFIVDNTQTVIYGVCDNCAHTNDNKEDVL